MKKYQIKLKIKLKNTKSNDLLIENVINSLLKLDEFNYIQSIFRIIISYHKSNLYILDISFDLINDICKDISKTIISLLNGLSKSKRKFKLVFEELNNYYYYDKYHYKLSFNHNKSNIFKFQLNKRYLIEDNNESNIIEFIDIYNNIIDKPVHLPGTNGMCIYKYSLCTNPEISHIYAYQLILPEEYDNYGIKIFYHKIVNNETTQNT